MIFDKDTVMQQVGELLHHYTSLQLVEESIDRYVLSGHIYVNRTSRGYTLSKQYQIQIVIPLLSNDLPYVVDIGQSIAKDYPHRYLDGHLCLETDTCIRIRFVDGFSLSEWVSDFVEPYFFSYEYYTRYGEFPFGERRHDISGILQTYEELFEVADDIGVWHLMIFITTQRYRGHKLCPCGSGKKLRACHGHAIMQYCTDKRLKNIVQQDCDKIRKRIEEYDKQRRNSEQTKR